MNFMGGYEKTILIVDSDRDFNETLSDILKEAGYKVVAATDAVGACELLHNNYFCAVILQMDRFLPRSEKVIRALSDGSSKLMAPTIFPIGDAELSLDKGDLVFARFLKKPFSVAELMQELQRHLI